ncbi:MAG: AMP-binding protein [Actinomycetota bacterium]
MLGAGGELQNGPTSAIFASAWRLFALTAATTPEREAVSANGERRTFAELLAGARRMAAGLQVRGVRTGVVVGICMSRRSDLIVAMLATWCAGGAFLLLDPQHPEARRRLLLTEAGVALVVADDPFADVEPVSVSALLAGSAEPAATGRPAAAPAYVGFNRTAEGRDRRSGEPGRSRHHPACADVRTAACRSPGQCRRAEFRQPRSFTRSLIRVVELVMVGIFRESVGGYDDGPGGASGWRFSEVLGRLGG